MEKDKNSKYWEYMEQNEAVKDAIQPDIGVGKEIILLICEHNVSQSSWFNKHRNNKCVINGAGQICYSFACCFLVSHKLMFYLHQTKVNKSESLFKFESLFG